MSTVIKIQKLHIRNLKNVKNGSFQTNTHTDTLNQTDVIGFYGQNGSGKTAIVEAFKLLKKLLSGKKLPSNSDWFIYYGEETLQLSFTFLAKIYSETYFIFYDVELAQGNTHLYVKKERIQWKEDMKGKRRKDIVAKEEEKIYMRNIPLERLDEKNRIKLSVANELATKNHTSFIFTEEIFEALQSKCLTSKTVIESLMHDFNRDFHVIDTIQYGLVASNILMPFIIHLDTETEKNEVGIIRGSIPYEISGDTMTLPTQVYNVLENVIQQINIVLKEIIFGLQIKIKKIHIQTLEDGKEGTRFEFLSNRNNIELPLRTESAGILKLISILSALIAVYNKPNACVVIDELDAGIFEYLLGEILEVLEQNGKGQLFFTSHNLRVLEVLPIQNLWFTTQNEENRFIQLKGVKKLSNARDIYLRAVQLGGQDEDIYAQIHTYFMKSAFRKAGSNDE